MAQNFDDWKHNQPPPRPVDPRDVRILIRGTRAASSEEIEQRERYFFTTKDLGFGVSWPPAFFGSADDEHPETPTAGTPEYAAMAKDLEHYSISVEEWRELMKREGTRQ